jgi:hypothetical protein
VKDFKDGKEIRKIAEKQGVTKICGGAWAEAYGAI